MTEDTFIAFDRVSKYYQVGEMKITAVKDITFTLQKGAFTVIVGASGAGKTTVLNMLGGMDTCSSGRILLDGSEISSYSPKRLTAYRRHEVGFVFQFKSEAKRS